jgi:hypothetical protein
MLAKAAAVGTVMKDMAEMHFQPVATEPTAVAAGVAAVKYFMDLPG